MGWGGWRVGVYGVDVVGEWVCGVHVLRCLCFEWWEHACVGGV